MCVPILYMLTGNTLPTWRKVGKVGDAPAFFSGGDENRPLFPRR